jgi:hypothetical protein
MMKLVGISLCVLALAASGAAAQTMLANFESGNPFSGGTVVADPDNAANHVLQVTSGTVTLNLAAPLAAGEKISMRVYDQGKSARDNADHTGPDMDGLGASEPTIWGWNLGVAGTYNWGVALANRKNVPANAGYIWAGATYAGWPKTANNIWTYAWFNGPRQVDALSIIGTGTIANPQIPGDGKWSTWVFTFNADGSITLRSEGQGKEKTSPAVETTITQVFAASYSTDLGGVWIDDVQLVAGIAPCNPGDADADGDVDLDDFVLLKNNFGTTTGATCAMGDFDADGDVDLDDFVLLKNNFGATY